ncbi:MAG: chromosome segregation protein SMC [Acidobacteria bacterium RIFCSPLOWO2_02_FULL_65_29]|nr:MAG: chromosome segregation protein SMC [Acidobacteria bacterium RIFCSPLOWO2_02_FULL_65_29]
MLIRRLKVSGLLSFGPKGIDLPLEDLNVLIGANGSGKSNLLEVLALLRASPTNLPEPVKEMGGVREWLWKGPESRGEASIDAVVDYPQGRMPVRHVLHVTEHGGRFEVADERIENERPHAGMTDPYFYYRFQQGQPVLNDLSDQRRGLRRENVKPEQSILSQVRDPESYPVLNWLQQQYERIRLYRNWSFGPAAAWRQEQTAHGRSDMLTEGGENLALVLSKFRSSVKKEMLESLKKLFEGIEDINLQVDGGKVLLFLEETGGREIPATRLSDGTLRYLSLLAILLHPDPPPLVAIEEPELGLHPDVMPHIADLLVRASSRSQLIVTTHSRLLVDALTDRPSTVVVCAKENGESRFERLDKAALQAWLDKYSLGDLWSMGELGGNRF